MPSRQGAVHVATTRRTYKGKVYQTHLLRRSYRQGGKVKHQTLGNLSHLPPDLIDTIRRRLGGQPPAPGGGWEIIRSLPHGHIAAVLGTLRKVGLEGILAPRPSRQRKLVVAMIVARVVTPASKLATARSLREETATTSLGLELGLDGVEDGELYRAMDWLGKRQEEIEDKLARQHLDDGTLILYDVSSSYYTGRCSRLIKFGYRRPLRGQAKIGQRVGGVLNRYKMGKHFAIQISDHAFSYCRDEMKIAEEAALDGIYVIRTSVTAEAFEPEGVVRAYKELAKVEGAFRSMKTIDLKVRPIYHWLDDRIRAHVFLCMLAYYVEWHMRRHLAPLLFDDHDPAAAEAERTSIVAPAGRSPAAKQKDAIKRTEDDYPVHNFRTLLADLGTLAKNRVRLPETPNQEFHLLTQPTILQQKAFDLLDVTPAL